MGKLDNLGVRKMKQVNGLLAIGTAALLAACGGSGSDGAATNLSAQQINGRVFEIAPGPNATQEMLDAMVQLKPKDTLRFTCGFFDLTSGIQITQTEDVIVEGCGKDGTFLSFANSTGQEGFLAANVQQIVLRDLTIGDSPGDAVKMKSVNHGQIERVRTIWSSGRKIEGQERLITADNWKNEINVACTQPATTNPNGAAPGEPGTTSPDYTVSNASGRYGIYPVESRNILVDEVESIGASDAGIYVGQTNIAKIRNSRAAFNVFGFEIENVQQGEYFNNLAECNTGGFLVYDLDGLTRYGQKSRVYNNVSRNNNTYNFATPGSIVANVPRGSGLITLAYDKIDIFDNTFEDNGTAGIILTSYELLGIPGDRRIDYYTEGVNIYNNTFINNGNDLPRPDVAGIIATQGEQVTSAFPALVGLKNVAGGGQYKGAHIVWDGYEDTLDADCPYPVDFEGNPIPARSDGRPDQSNKYPNPDCIYNKYKFDDNGQRKGPEWWFSCIDPQTNSFDAQSPAYANFHGTRGLEAVFAIAEQNPEALLTPDVLVGVTEFPSSFDMSPHDCRARYGEDLPPIADFEFEPYEPSGAFRAAEAEELARAACELPLVAGKVNEAAFDADCEDLAQYNLFENAQDPTSMPNSQGMPYVLNTKLFSDYSTKHRVIFIPEGKQATYLADEQNQINSVLDFPIGTIIAKTFSFVDQPNGVETAYETRLLIKRERSDGTGFWQALEYVWQDTAAGRVAKLSQGGGTAAASWDYVDVESGKRHVGNTPAYLFPNSSQCSLCHSNLGVDAGSAPIGPKPRNLNRPFTSESPLMTASARHPIVGQNQLKFMCDTGLMKGCPSDLTTNSDGRIESAGYIPKYHKAGDSGKPAGSPEDIELRARAYLEVNCAHCHNIGGQASNTGFYTDVFRKVDGTFGICKKPTAAGSEGRGNRIYDIHPGTSGNSILPYRMGPDAVVAAAKMPPLARSVPDVDAVELMNTWIDTVINDTYEGADGCTEQAGGNSSGNGLPGPLSALQPPAGLPVP